MKSTVFGIVVLWTAFYYVRLIKCDSEEKEEVKIPTFKSFCQDLKNVTIQQPKRVLYFQCFPFVLGMVKEDEMYEVEETYLPTLLEVPKESEPTVKVNIVVEKLTLLTFSVQDNTDFNPDLQMEFKLSWQDDRLKWDPTEWRFSIYPVELKPETHIWAPKFVLKGASSMSALVESMSYYKTKVQNTGNVTTTALSQITMNKCEVDLAAYPNDPMKCCVNVSLTPKSKIVVTDLSNKIVDPSFLDKPTDAIWTIQSIVLTKNEKNDADLQLCLNAERNAVAIGSELNLTMAVSAVVLICAQLAGKWKMQVYVKLFVILIQIFTFKSLVPTKTLSNAIRLPRVYLFYNFTLAITIFSLFQTMLFWALSRRWFIMPPPHRLTLSMKVVSRYLLGSKLERISQQHVEQLEPTKTDYKKEWEVIFGTIHAILSLIIIISYLVGVIVIYASSKY